MYFILKMLFNGNPKSIDRLLKERHYDYLVCLHLKKSGGMGTSKTNKMLK